MEKPIHPKKNHLFLFYKNLVQAAHIPVFLVFLFTVFKKEVHMKATTAFKSTFISLLFCIPAIPVFAQSVPIVGTEPCRYKSSQQFIPLGTYISTDIS